MVHNLLPHMAEALFAALGRPFQGDFHYFYRLEGAHCTLPGGHFGALLLSPNDSSRSSSSLLIGIIL